MRRILFITSTHGDEQLGTRVLRDLEKKFPKTEYGYDWIIGNERAFKNSSRFVEQDLNRSAPGDIKSKVYELRRAAEIIKISRGFDAVIDLHGTKTDSGIVTIIPYPTLQNVEFAVSIGLARNVVWFAESSQEHGPLLQHMEVPAIEIECGPKNSPETIKLLYTLIHNILIANKEGTVVHDRQQPEFYNVYGKQPGKYDPGLRDFVLTTVDGESFYPFLSGNEYSGIKCYKMKKVARKRISLK